MMPFFNLYNYVLIFFRILKKTLQHEACNHGAYESRVADLHSGYHCFNHFTG
jgi:hypothetical protein